MAQKPTPEFRAEAVRVALTSGLPRKQVAADLGIGFSTLSRCFHCSRREQKNGRSKVASRNCYEPKLGINRPFDCVFVMKDYLVYRDREGKECYVPEPIEDGRV